MYYQPANEDSILRIVDTVLLVGGTGDFCAESPQLLY
jgi:hypothetical protein